MGFLTIDQIVAEVQSGVGNHNLDQLAISTGFGASVTPNIYDGLLRIYRFINMTMIEIAQLRVATGGLYRHRELEETNTQPIVGNNTGATWPVRAYATNPWPYVAGFTPPETYTFTLGIISVRMYDIDAYSNGWRLNPIRDRTEFDNRVRSPGAPRWYGLFAATDADWPANHPNNLEDGKTPILLSPPPSMDYDGWALEIRRYRYPRYVQDPIGSVPPNVGAQIGGLGIRTAVDGRPYCPEVTDFSAAWDEVIIAGTIARTFRALNLVELANKSLAEFNRLMVEVAKRGAMDAEDLDFGPHIEIPNYQAR